MTTKQRPRIQKKTYLRNRKTHHGPRQTYVTSVYRISYEHTVLPLTWRQKSCSHHTARWEFPPKKILNIWAHYTWEFRGNVWKWHRPVFYTICFSFDSVFSIIFRNRSAHVTALLIIDVCISLRLCVPYLLSAVLTRSCHIFVICAAGIRSFADD